MTREQRQPLVQACYEKLEMDLVIDGNKKFKVQVVIAGLVCGIMERFSYSSINEYLAKSKPLNFLVFAFRMRTLNEFFRMV